jgi:hypothetical protein
LGLADYDSGFGRGCGVIFLDYLAGLSGSVVSEIPLTTKGTKGH